MKLVDANILLYAVNSDAKRHERSCRWLDEALSGQDTVAFAWIALLAFVRLSTKVGFFPSPPAVVVEPTVDHARIVRGMLERLG